jgi:predicted nucleic acid-binding protein
MICEAVLTEASHLAAKEGLSPDRLMDFVADGQLAVPSMQQEILQLRKLLEQYADTPMDFSDACVTRLAELHGDAAVLTTDSGFLVYRKSSGAAIPLIVPFVPQT